MKKFWLFFTLILTLNMKVEANPTTSLAFWRSNKVTKLTFTSTNSNLLTWSCSTMAVKRADSANRSVTIGTTTVTLSGSNVTYYSDIDCTVPITSIDIVAPASTATFYYSFTTPGALSINASTGGGVTSVAQNTTVTMDPYTWMGGGGNANWNTAGNWFGGSVPGASNTAHFDSHCSANCSPTLNVTPTSRGIYMHTGYGGTISQSAGVAVTLATSTGNFVQEAGTFTGVDANITFGGDFYLLGGTFTSTSAILSVTQSNYTVSGSPVFNHNSGTVTIGRTTAGTIQVKAGTVNYMNVILAGYAASIDMNGGTMNVDGNLTLSDTYSSTANAFNNGTIIVKGNLESQNYGRAGTGVIKVAGSSNQTITGVSGARFPHIEIISTGGTVTLAGTIYMIATSYTHTSGTVDAGTSTLYFDSISGVTVAFVPGATIFNNLTFRGWGEVITLTGTATVAGNLTIGDAYSGGGQINGGTIEAKGNVTFNNQGKIGTTNIKISGNTNQTVTGTAGARVSAFEIASTGGTVTISGTLDFSNTFKNTSGTISIGTSTIIFSGNQTITSNGLAFHNVSFLGTNATHTLSGDITVNGTLGLGDASSTTGGINSGNVLAYGDINLTNFGKLGSGIIRVVGSSNQTITGGSSSYLPSLEISSTGGTVSYVGTIRINLNYDYVSGVVAPGTSSFVFMGSGIINPGNFDYYDVTFAGANRIHNLNSNTLKVTGTLTLNDGSSSIGALNSGTIIASGPIVCSNYGKAGNATIKIAGSSNQTFTVSGVNCRLPALEIASTGGTVTVNGSTRLRSNYTYTSGTVDASAWTLMFEVTATIVPGNVNYFNVGFYGSNQTMNLSSGTMNVTGTLTFGDTSGTTGSVNSGTFSAKGNVVFSSFGKLGNAILIMEGSSAATFTSPSGTRTLGTTTIQVAKTGGATVTLAANSVLAAGQTLNVTGGNIAMSGFSFTVPGTITLNGNTITKGGGVLTVGGSAIGTGSLLGGTVSP